ncbi:MAG TPA: STAS domain-containing protein [Acidisarcina sp.]
MAHESEITHLDSASAIVTVRGRLTTGSHLSVTQAQLTRLVDTGVTHLLIDLSSVEYLDSAALGMLIQINGELRTRSGELRLAGANARILSLLRLTGTEQMLNVYPDMESGRTGFAS